MSEKSREEAISDPSGGDRRRSIQHVVKDG